MLFNEDPKTRKILDEADALSRALRAVETGQGLDEARASVRRVFRHHVAIDTLSAVTHHAMSRIAGEPSQVMVDEAPKSGSAEEKLIAAIAQAWLAWAMGHDTQSALDRLSAVVEDDLFAERGSALHLMALHPWAVAVRSLLRGEADEARRFFRRAIELAGQLGTETSEVVQWVYAASFSPHRVTQED